MIALCAKVGTCTVAVMVFLFAGGCDYLSGKRQRTWSEEVRLDDRSIITVDRDVEFDESKPWAASGAYNATETRSTLSFRDELATLPKWEVPLVALLLYRDTNTMGWVIVATTSSCEVWHARGSPMPPYWEFRLGRAGWRETPLSTASLNRETNLLFLYNRKLPSKHFDLSTKSKARSDDRIAPEYLKIVQSVEGQFCGLWNPKASESAEKKQ